MEQNTPQNIPKYLIDVINSPELFSALDRIEKNLDLHIDQTGELYVIVSNIILGKTKSSDFSKNVMENLGVNADMSNKIMGQTNKEIFDVMKSKLQSQTPTENAYGVPTIESVGNFKIEKEDGDETAKSDVTPADREKILNGLENPPLHSGAVPPNLPVSSEDAGPFNDIGVPKTANNSIENHTEPIVDYLLSNPAGQGQKKVVVETKDTVPQPQTITKPPLAVQQRRGPDPYREAVK